MSENGRQVLIGQLTDTHVLAVDDTDTEVFVDNNARLADAVTAINRERPGLDLVIGTGDLTNDGRSAEFDALMGLLAGLEVPFLPLPGNHDDPAELRRRFAGVPWATDDHASWVTNVGSVRVVGLDTTRAGAHGGEVDVARATWLRDVLSIDHDGVTMLAMHHPPFASGIGWMDRDGFRGVERLTEVLVDHRVDRIVCGHLHRPTTSAVAGVPAQVGMATVQHVELHLGDDDRVSVIDDPVGYQIHRIVDRSIVTHARFIRTAEPVVPAWADEYG